jgi:predicted unusual protein kinase regulating ubiquinone biosynthesis (AarF/ABC1/UbiB family)
MTVRSQRLRRGVAALRLAARGGARYAGNAPRLFALAGERRQALRNDLALRTAEDVAATLGTMKGVLMKLGQMASYVHDGLSPEARRTLSRLQDSVPPMTPELAAGVISAEFGAPPAELFSEWDPVPIAAASIGQVHRAITRDGQAVAVKVQYPGIARSITSDLRNVGLLRRIVGAAFPGLDTRTLVDELGERLQEEVDYLREAESQELFARYYDGHPFIRVPHVIPELSTARVLTSELVSGAGFEELLRWDQHERDLAAETIHRFVFRSLYRLHAFNGDPHPGNYLFHRGGSVTFLDFGLTKLFTDDDLAPLVDAVRFLVFEKDYEAFRAALERAGFLKAGAPVPTSVVVDRFGQFYGTVLQDAPMTITPDYASAIVRRFFDARGPLAPYSDVPRAYVIMQRINLGLYAVLGSLYATANWRRIAEEIWPFRNGPPSTPWARPRRNGFSKNKETQKVLTIK